MAAKPIVAATNGSPASMNAVAWAAREAALRGAPLRIVSVPAGRSTGGAAPDTCLPPGQPVDGLVQAAEGAALLAVGAHGRVLHALAGSVSRYVAARAACPVVIVRAGPAAEHHLIGVGVHLPVLAGAAFRFAFQEAALHQAAVLAVHAYSFAEAAWQLDEELARWRDKYPYLAVSQEVVHARPGRLLAGLSARADLVVLGRHDVPGSVLNPFLGPAVHTALNHQHGPIAVVPSSWPGD